MENSLSGMLSLKTEYKRTRELIFPCKEVVHFPDEISQKITSDFDMESTLSGISSLNTLNMNGQEN